MQMQHQGDDIDDSVSHFLNTSLLGGVAESPGAHAGSMTHSPARSSSLSSSPFKSPGLLHGSHNSLAPSQYPLGSAYAHLSGYPFLPTSTNYDYTAIAPMSAGLRPRSAADHPVDGLDRQHPLGSGYFDSYPPDRLPPFHNHNQSHNYNSSSRNSGYIFDTRVLVSGSAPFLTLAVPGSGVPLLGSDLQSDTASTSTSSPYIPMGYLDHSALHAHGGILPESASEHSTAMVFPSHHPASDEVFYAPSDLYLADSTGGALQQPQREDMAQEAFTLPGIPSAEEAFLSHLNDTPSGIDPAVISKVDDPLPGDPRRDLLLLSSGFQTPLELPSSSDFGSDDLEIEHTLYNAHIGTRSPSGSDSSRSSQKRARGKPDYFSPASTVMGSTEWSSVMSNKRQRLDLIEEEHDTPVPSGSRRTRARRLSNAGPSFRNDDEDDVFESGGDDSDLYIPSRSPSPNHPRLYLPSSSPPASEGEEQTPMPAKVRPGRRRRGGKAKGSAAKALAMITQAQKEELLQQLSDQGYNEHVTECGSNLAYMVRGINEDYEGGSSRGGRSVSPAPIPNLTKKSRGRKVPYVAAVRGGTGIGEGIPLSGATGGVMPLSQNGRIRGKPARKAISGTGGRRGRGGRGGRAGRGGAGESRLEYLEMRGLMDQAASPPPQSVQEPSGEERSFVCTIPGCGKCFIRGEHLKRHVRSIHTEDKPYMCPYKGCGKSFSRRDNLGQHVRIHLND